MKLSVCILVKNQASFLSNCLQRIYNYADEIIVINNDSTDDTVDVAKNYGAFIIDVSGSDFDNLRNSYIKAANGDWILVLDADEIFEKKGIDEIREVIKSDNLKYMGYGIQKNEYLGLGKWAISKNLRLFKNCPEIRYNVGTIHSSVSYSIHKNGWLLNRDKIMTPIRHLDILLGEKTSAKRIEYITAIKKNISETNDNSYKSTLYNYLSQEYFAIGELNEAKICIDTALYTHSEACNLSNLYAMIYYLKTKEFSKAFSISEEFFKREISAYIYKRVMIILTEIFLQMNKYDKAIETYNTVFEKAIRYPYDYINMGSLILKYDSQKAYEAYDMFLKALSLDNFLYNPIIYKKGNTPNIFEHQTIFLSCTDNIFISLIECCDLLGKSLEKGKFINIYDNILKSTSLFNN